MLKIENKMQYQSPELYIQLPESMEVVTLSNETPPDILGDNDKPTLF